MSIDRTGDARIDTVLRAVEILQGSDAIDVLLRTVMQLEREVSYATTGAAKLEAERDDYQRRVDGCIQAITRMAALIGEWRVSATKLSPAEARAVERCADQLSAALRGPDDISDAEIDAKLDATEAIVGRLQQERAL